MMLSLNTVRFYLIVFATCLGTSGLMYTATIFNNTVIVLHEFINGSYYSQTGQYPSAGIIYSMYSFLTCTLNIGAVGGAALGNLVSEKLGRKRGIMLLSAINILGTIIAVISTPTNLFELMMVGRTIQGFAMGMAFAIGGLYLGEISPTNRRGLVLSCLQLSVSITGLLGVILGLPHALGTIESLWLLQFVQAIPSILMIILLPFCPETPPHLYLSKKDKTAAMESIIFYQSNERLFDVLEDLEREEVHSTNIVYINWKDLFSVEYRKVFLISMVCVLGYCASGVPIITSYSSAILVDSGVKYATAQISTIVAFCVALFVSVPFMILVERTGRRVTFLFGLYGTFVVIVLFTGFHVLTPTDRWASIMCIVLLLASFVTNTVGNMVHWFIVNEMFDQKARSKAVTVSSTLQWVVEAISLLIFYPVMEASNAGYAMLPIGLISLATAIFVTILLPETKNKTPLEVLQLMSME